MHNLNHYKYFLFQCLSIVSLLLLSSNSYGQNLFPEKFKGCNTDKFGLERDTITAKVSSQDIISIVTSALSEEEIKRISGILALQIIVEADGKSCLISVKNDTNVKTKNLRLKENIDSKLSWRKVTERIAAVVVLKFENGAVSMKRLGMDMERGVHELRP